MKKLLLVIAASASVLLFSCQKELNPDGFNGSGSTAGLLTKLIIRSGADSNVASFTYNSNNKLVGVNTQGIDAGTVIDTREKFVRNSQGIITEIVTKDADLAAQGIDSVVSKIGYSNGRYINRVSIIDFFGVLQFRDSAVFSYDGSGNIITVEDLLDVGTGYEPFRKSTYSYSGKNIASMKYFSYDDSNGTYVETGTQTLTYDTKLSPLNLGIEAFALGYYNWYSANNIVKSVAVSASDPTQNETQDVTYVYNSANKPSTGTTVIQGGPTATHTYIYN